MKSMHGDQEYQSDGEDDDNDEPQLVRHGTPSLQKQGN